MTDTTRNLFNKMTTGSNNNTWGTEGNTNLDEIDASLDGLEASVSVTAADVTLTDDQQRKRIITTTGTLTGNRAIIVAAREKNWRIYNGCAGAFTLTVKVSGQTGVVIPQGTWQKIYCNATDVFFAQSQDASTTNVLTGTSIATRVTPDALASLWERNTTDITDGAAITIGDGGSFNLITSTTAITSFSITTDKSGRKFRVRFDTARTLTHNATSLILPGGANITTAAGDICEVESLGSGNVRVNWYTKADGTPVVGGANASATVRGIVELSTAAEFRNDTADRALTGEIVWDAAAEVTLTDGATIAVDMATFINAIVTLGGNRTLGQPSNTKVGQSGCIRIVQDGTGSRTLAYHADWKFAGGTDPVLTTTASAIDLLFYQVIAANVIYANLVKAIA
jgi:hypothetical protein